MLKVSALFSWRWFFPFIITLIWSALLVYKSPNPTLFARYNYPYFFFLLSFTLLTGVTWWTSLSRSRYIRFISRVVQFPVISLVISLGGSFVLVDIFFDLIFFFFLMPLVLVIIIGLFTASTPLRNLDRRIIPSKAFTQRAALIVGAILLALTISEILFRSYLAKPKVPKTEQQFTDLISSAWPRELPVKKPPGTFRILGLSDSFGRIGGHENYHYLLETMLVEAGFQVEIVNLSVVDYAPSDELEILQRFGARYQPDLVLHGFYVGNDFGIPETSVMTYLGIGLRPAQGYIAYRPRNFLLVQWIKFYLQVFADRRVRNAETNPKEPRGVFSREGYLRVTLRNLEVMRLDPPPQQRWAATVQQLNKIYQAVAQMNAHYLMVIHPDPLQVEDNLYQELQQAYNLKPRNYDLELPQQFLRYYCHTQEILCLDLLPIFKSAGNEAPFYLYRDIHYNTQGNKLAAQTIFSFLQTKGLLPK